MVKNSEMGKTSARSAILKSELFTKLLPKERKSVTEKTGIIHLRKGKCLFSPGDKAGHLYMLQSGLIRIYKTHEDGNDEEIAHFTPGDIIGDFDFARDAEYDAKAEALEDSSLSVFPGFGLTMDSFAGEAPQVVSKIFLNSAAMVTGRIKATRKLLINNMSWVQELHRKAYEDPATGLWKQTFLTDEINRLLEDPMALIVLKPDRFKILVDALGHEAGDEAMIKIAAKLKSITRRLGRGWAIRFKSNETGLLVNKCNAAQAESLALSLAEAVASIHAIPLGDGKGEFSFTGSIAWGIWPKDDNVWESCFDGIYRLLMETWKAGGEKVVRYRKGHSS